MLRLAGFRAQVLQWTFPGDAVVGCIRVHQGAYNTTYNGHATTSLRVVTESARAHYSASR